MGAAPLSRSDRVRIESAHKKNQAGDVRILISAVSALWTEANGHNPLVLPVVWIFNWAHENKGDRLAALSFHL